MSIELIVTATLIILGFIVIVYFINLKISEFTKKDEEDEAQRIIVEWLKDMRGSLDKNLGDVNVRLDRGLGNMNKRLDNAAKVIGEFQKHLGVMADASKYIRDLHETLQAPKLRGNIGEQILNDLLKQSFPQGKFRLQYQFKTGDTVDALVYTAEGSIPIDSKFPLESFRRYLKAESQERERVGKEFTRDVKKHIDDISKKYILPEEGTIDFAVMYVPSEPVAYEILNNFPDLLEHAHKMRVSIVSPNQFNHLIKVVLMGFEKQRVSEQAKQIIVHLRGIRGDTSRFSEDLRLLTKHVTNAKNAADSATTSFSRLEGKIESVEKLPESEDDAPLLS